jgi:hypothetical protein
MGLEVEDDAVTGNGASGQDRGGGVGQVVEKAGRDHQRAFVK